MEKQLSLVLKLSLQEMAFRRIMVHLWSKTVILASNKNLILKSRSYSGRTQNANDEYNVSYINKVIEDMVKDDVLGLMLPEHLQERMIHLIKPIGLEILKWQINHLIIVDFLCKESRISVLEQLHWTSTGVIDYRKTAEELVRLEMLDVVKRYQLACEYCVVDYIPLLWKELPEENKEHFSKDLSTFCVYTKDKLQIYWSYFLKGEVYKLDSFVSQRFGGVSSYHQLVFEDLAKKGIKVAAEYFSVRLTNEEREFSLFKTISYIMDVIHPCSIGKNIDFVRGILSDIICYLLSKMTFEKQMKVLMQWPCEILGYFLQWPWQDLFLDVADVIWTFLPESSYDKMLNKIAENIQYRDCCLPDLIQKFFQRSPRNFINHFVNTECETFDIFTKLFIAEDIETIKVIFTLLDAKDRARLVSSYPFTHFLYDLVVKNKWKLVELFLREAMLSREKDKEKLKEDFRRFFAATELQKQRLFEFLDKMEENRPIKRSSVETKTKIKKLCCEQQTNE